MVFNGAQFHLLLNHLPVVGFVGIVLLLAIALVVRSVDIKRLVLGMTVIVGLSSLPALWTGEPAEEVVEHMSGVSEELIHAHEEAAELATILAIVTAIVAAVALVLQFRDPSSIGKGLAVVLVLSLVALAALGKAAHDGGKIRHPEIMSE